MAVVGLVYVTVPGLVLAPFFDSGDDRAVEIATQLLLVAAVLQFFDCTQNIGIGLLRGLDDTKGGFRVTLVGYWLVGPCPPRSSSASPSAWTPSASGSASSPASPLPPYSSYAASTGASAGCPGRRNRRRPRPDRRVPGLGQDTADR